MTAVNLAFGQTPLHTPPIDLVFGGGADLNLDAIDVTINVALPGLHGAHRLHNVQGVVFNATLPGLSGVQGLVHYNVTSRPTVADIRTSVQVAVPIELGITQPESISQHTTTGVQSWAQEAALHVDGFIQTFQEGDKSETKHTGVFQEGQRTETNLRGNMQEGDPHARAYIYGRMQDGHQHGRWSLLGRMQDGLHDRRCWLHSRYQESKRTGKRWGTTGNYANPASRAWHTRLQDAWPPRAGTSPLPPHPGTPGLPYWGTLLTFACPPLEFPNLVFGLTQCAGLLPVAGLAILPARFYMTTHNIFAQRVPDGLGIPIFDATIAADSGSYCWSLSASGPANLFNLLAPTGGLPAQLRVTLDGLPFLFAIDSLSRTQQFGQTGVRIQGRSVTSLIAAPYLRATTYSNTEASLAQQLATDALLFSGVDLDWGLTDWLVPAGAWSHKGTPLEAVQAIAQAAGGYLQSARNTATIQTRHPYAQRAGDNPGAPWGWMTGPADVDIAPDALITCGVTRKDGADINGVYVSGTSAGVLALVKRTGTAADKLAAMATNPLITHTDVARQMGLSILGAAGSKYEVAIELPVLTGAGQPGILDVGQLVQVSEATPWRGRVRAVSVSAKAPSLRQTVTLERHLEIA